jgi:DNA-binding NtrC family response regulator
VITIPLPPLKDRREDIPLLIDHLLKTRQIGKTPYTVSADALAVLLNYDWPGNIRELANVLERAQILAEGQVITRDDLPDNLVTGPALRPTEVTEGPFDLEALERRHVQDVLAQMKGNKVQAAKALGVSRRALYRLIDKHGLQSGKKRTDTPSAATEPPAESTSP